MLPGDSGPRLFFPGSSRAFLGVFVGLFFLGCFFGDTLEALLPGCLCSELLAKGGGSGVHGLRPCSLGRSLFFGAAPRAFVSLSVLRSTLSS